MSSKMKIKIFQKGGKKNHEILESATRKFASSLMSNKMANTLEIRIELRSSKLNSRTRGQVTSAANGSKATKKFLIVIQRDMDLAQQIKTLAHEMVHVMQLAYGRLQYRYLKTTGRVHDYWKPEGSNKAVDMTEVEYWNRPWEVEAREKTEKITVGC